MSPKDTCLGGSGKSWSWSEEAYRKHLSSLKHSCRGCWGLTTSSGSAFPAVGVHSYCSPQASAFRFCLSTIKKAHTRTCKTVSQIKFLKINCLSWRTFVVFVCYSDRKLCSTGSTAFRSTLTLLVLETLVSPRLTVFYVLSTLGPPLCVPAQPVGALHRPLSSSAQSPAHSHGFCY